MKRIFVVLTLIILGMGSVAGQTAGNGNAYLYSNKFSVLAGLLQPTALKGGNIEFNYFTNKVAFDYSHGWSLNPPVVGDYKDQNLVLHLPYSTGFGIGYRFSSFFDIRFEPKLHSWEVYYKDDAQSDLTRIKDFKTITFGIGAYYRYFPFKNSTSTALQGITISSSIRWWQNFGSTVGNDEFSYLNKTTAKVQTLKVPNIGVANSPIIVNIAVGYTLGGK
jgi:hypothetical protein